MNTSRKFVALVAVGLLVGSPAQALTVTLDLPNQTVARPDSGMVAVKFFGTISFDAGESWDGNAILFPFLANSTSFDAKLQLSSLCLADICKNGGSGEIFSYSVSSTDALGLYGFLYDSTDPAFFRVQAVNSAGESVAARANYSINVVESVAPPVPLPAAAWLLLSGLGGLGFLGRRRKTA